MKKLNNWPCSIKRIFSNVKVEKVVSPPQKPTANNICCVLDTEDLVLRKPSSNPNSKQPIAFAISVANGNCGDMVLRTSPMVYRKRLPSPPPIKTSKKEMPFMLHDAF